MAPPSSERRADLTSSERQRGGGDLLRGEAEGAEPDQGPVVREAVPRGHALHVCRRLRARHRGRERHCVVVVAASDDPHGAGRVHSTDPSSPPPSRRPRRGGPSLPPQRRRRSCSPPRTPPPTRRRPSTPPRATGSSSSSPCADGIAKRGDLGVARGGAVGGEAKDEAASVAAAESAAAEEQGEKEEGPTVAPVVVFVNSKSGGRHGPELKVRLHELITEEQVFDLSVVKPSDFVHYGLSCLERLADQGDDCAKAAREKMRIVVAGGDGTVGWMLGCLSDLYKMKREPVPPTGIIPLGTGNDLARSFGWGGSFPFGWRSAVKRYLSKAATGPICCLDSWQTVIQMPEGEIKELPYALKKVEPADRLEISQENGSELPEKASCYKGVFYNYLSIGMDAQVAYGFHHLRDEKPYLAQGPVANKLIYAGYSCTQGWFCTPCTASPQLRGLKNILRLYIKKANCSEWEQVQMPSSVRSLVVLNLYNYGSGRHPWGDLKPEYLEKRGFVEAHSDDGLLEIFGLKEGWHASFVMAELIKAKHIAQAAAIKFEMRGGAWNRAYVQMDGEPWKQPLIQEVSTILEINKVPNHSLMITGEQ